jgi:hypothetical protein
MALKSLMPTLPLKAAHLRLHRSLDLHLFDVDGQLLAAVPLKDQMVSIRYVEENDEPPKYLVCPDQADPSQSMHLHFGLALPSPESEYYDSNGGDSLAPAAGLKFGFRFGFQRHSEDARTSELVGIGTVDIADISIGPIPIGRGLPNGCNPLGWFVKPKPIPFDPTIVGKPIEFPESLAPQFSITYSFGLYCDKRVDGAHHIRLGAFMGKTTDALAPEPYLMVLANPLLVTLQASTIGK